MEILIGLFFIMFVIALMALLFDGSAAPASNRRLPSEEDMHDIGNQTRANIDDVVRNHKQQTFDYLYQKHQEAVEEALHD